MPLGSVVTNVKIIEPFETELFSSAMIVRGNPVTFNPSFLVYNADQLSF